MIKKIRKIVAGVCVLWLASLWFWLLMINGVLVVYHVNKICVSCSEEGTVLLAVGVLSLCLVPLVFDYLVEGKVNSVLKKKGIR